MAERGGGVVYGVEQGIQVEGLGDALQHKRRAQGLHDGERGGVGGDDDVGMTPRQRALARDGLVASKPLTPGIIIIHQRHQWAFRRAQRPQCLRAIARFEHAMPGILQRAALDRADGVVVVNDCRGRSP